MRGDRVRAAWTDGRSIAEWSGDPARLRPTRDQALDDPARVGLGAFESDVLFERARQTPLEPGR